MIRKKARAFRTPKKNATIKNELLDKLQNLVRDLDDIRGFIEASQDEAFDPVELRIATLEMQMKLLGRRLEEWATAQPFQSKEIQENLESINSRLIDLESIIGAYPSLLGGKLEPTLWDTIASLISKPEIPDPFHSPTWMKSVKDFRNLQSDFLGDKRGYENFQQV